MKPDASDLHNTSKCNVMTRILLSRMYEIRCVYCSPMFDKHLSYYMYDHGHFFYDVVTILYCNVVQVCHTSS